MIRANDSFRGGSMRLENWRWGLLIAAVLALYFYFVHVWARNIPFNDDLFDILKFFLGLNNANSARDIAEAFLYPHVDHRTTASRLLYYLLFKVQGEVDFVALTYVANIAVVAIATILMLQWKERSSRGMIGLAIFLLLLQPRAFGPMFCVMCGFAFFYVNLYGLLSLVLLKEVNPLRFIGAILCAVLATFTLASGQLIWLVGLVWLGYQYKWNLRRSWRYLASWLILAALSLVLYRYNWEAANTPGALFSLLLDAPLFCLQFAFATIGSAFAWGSTAAATVAGLLMVAALVWLTLRQWRDGLTPLHFFAWFLFIQCLAIAFGRATYAASLDNGMAFAVVPRYSFISLCLLASLMLLGIASLGARSRWLARISVLLAGVYWASSYLYYSQEVCDHWEHRLGFYNKQQYRMLGMRLKQSNKLVQRTIDQGLYRPPQRPVPLGNNFTRQMLSCPSR